MSPISLDAMEDSFSSMARRLGRMMDDMLGSSYVRFSGGECWRPAVNLYETYDEFILCADLAGMPRDQIDVQAEPDRVVIRGTRADPQPTGEPETLGVHIMEIDVGPFGREVRLPALIEVEKIRATYRDGLLWVHMPRQKPRAIRCRPDERAEGQSE